MVTPTVEIDIDERTYRRVAQFAAERGLDVDEAVHVLLQTAYVTLQGARDRTIAVLADVARFAAARGVEAVALVALDTAVALYAVPLPALDHQDTGPGLSTPP